MITVEGVSKAYGKFRALNDVSFVARQGEVTGFLGPNGAGKSTCMRIMVGLTLPDSGQALIDGVNYSDLPNPGRHVGVLLDASAQHSGRTGREILRLGCMTMGLPLSRADEMLELVNLTKTEAGRRIGNYSLGMRQRLGIAHALLADPSVLILDEPANGLDPAGIHWMRTLLRDYAQRGGTVLLSSHLLHEVEQIADNLVLIGQGDILSQGTKAELLAGSGSTVYGEDPQALGKALSAAGIVTTTLADGGFRSQVEPVEIGRAAANAHVVLTKLTANTEGSLEQRFLELTAPTQREHVSPRNGGESA